MSEDQKYKAFRNYMTNELGITREDIRRWTQEAVEREVQRVVGQLNIHDLAQKAIKNCLDSWGTRSFSPSVSAALGAEICKRLDISVRSSETVSGEPK